MPDKFILHSNYKPTGDQPEAIEALGFVPNQQARVLTGAASNIIGLVVLDVESPFYMETAHAIERAVRESGHVVMLCNSEGEPVRESELLTMLAAQRVRGVLLAPAAAETGATWHRRLPQNLPVVLLDFPGGPKQCSVAVDNVAGGRLGVRHLLDLGHQALGSLHRREVAECNIRTLSCIAQCNGTTNSACSARNQRHLSCQKSHILFPFLGVIISVLYLQRYKFWRKPITT